MNIPPEERDTAERVFFQLEKAHWFYEDYILEDNPGLADLSFREFVLTYFEYCTLLKDMIGDLDAAMKDFVAYRSRVPVCGAIVLNDKMDSVLLVKGCKSGSSWHYPRGKINEGELEVDCAIREVYEEVGVDITPHIDENDYCEIFLGLQRVRLYFICGLGNNIKFCANTRREIGDIRWHSLADIPGWSRTDLPAGRAASGERYFKVSRFFSPMRKYIQNRRLGIRALANQAPGAAYGECVDASGAVGPEAHREWRPGHAVGEVINESELKKCIQQRYIGDSGCEKAWAEPPEPKRSEPKHSEPRHSELWLAPQLPRSCGIAPNPADNNGTPAFKPPEKQKYSVFGNSFPRDDLPPAGGGRPLLDFLFEFHADVNRRPEPGADASPQGPAAVPSQEPHSKSKPAPAKKDHEGTSTARKQRHSQYASFTGLTAGSSSVPLPPPLQGSARQPSVPQQPCYSGPSVLKTTKLHLSSSVTAKPGKAAKANRTVKADKVAKAKDGKNDPLPHAGTDLSGSKPLLLSLEDVFSRDRAPAGNTRGGSKATRRGTCTGSSPPGQPPPLATNGFLDIRKIMKAYDG